MKNEKIGMLIKRSRRIVLLTLLLVSLHGMVAFAYEDTIGTINDGGAKIRSQASTSSESLASVEGGKTITICGEKVGDDGYTWYLVYVNGTQTGYIRGDLLTNTGKKAGTVTPDTATNATSTATAPTTTDTATAEPAPAEETTQTDVVATPAAETAPAVGADCTLSSLTISQGVLEPAFAPTVTSYTVTLPEDVTTLAVFGVPTDAGASVVQNTGFTDLALGSNAGTLTVQGSDGTSLVYNFTIIRGSVDAVSANAAANTDATTETLIDQPTDQPTDTTSNSDASTLKVYKIIMVGMGIVIVLLIMLITFLAITIRDLKQSVDWDEDDEDEESEDDHYAHEEENYENERYEDEYYEEPRKQRASGRQPVKQQARQPVSQPVKQSAKQPENQPHNILKNEEQFYVKNNRPVEFDDDLEDELEDIREREATKDDLGKSKDKWRAVNFLAPEEEMEFEFMDLEEDER